MRIIPGGVTLACCLAAAGLEAGLAGALPPPGEGNVHRIKVVADKAPDCSSLRTIVNTVTRGCKTNDDKAIALYNFMQLTHYHQGYPGEPGGLGALKEINVYGWSLCGGLHTVEAALWREMGWPWRFVGWSNPGHTTVEAQYDGRWHYLDVFLRYYAWMPDPNAPGGRTIAGQDDIKANPALVTGSLELDRSRGVYYARGNRFENLDGRANWLAPSFLSCGDEPGGILTGIRSSNRAGSPTGWMGLRFDTPDYATDVNLAPGTMLSLNWDAIEGAHWWNGRKYVPRHGCGDKDYRNCPAIGPILEPYNRTGGLRRSFANGTLQVGHTFASDASLKGLAGRDNVKRVGKTLVPADPSRPASVTVELQSPYIMTRASGQADGAEAAAVSMDGGKTFKAVQLEDFSEEVGGKYACLVKLSFNKALRSLFLRAVVQCNRGALPYLSPGKNRITVSVADPRELGDNRLLVVYAYRPGFRSKSYEDLADAGAEVARAHNATWADQPTVVVKEFIARELPATFDIDVPTPQGKYPVYPRMVYVTRAVVPAGSPPPAFAPGVVAPQRNPGDELKTLPNPFTVGTAPPPPKVVRPTSTRTLPLRAGPVVSVDGQVQEHHFLKWKGATWALLIGGELQGLPPAKDIAAARLVFPVARGHAKAATTVGVTLLSVPFQDGKAYDFKNLGEVVGTAIVPRQPDDADYNPPKTFAVDVTRALKRIAAGDALFRGFALRVVQDRAVDDGYIVRVDLPRAPRLALELDVYDRK